MVVDRKVDIRPMSLRASSSCSRMFFFEFAKVTLFIRERFTNTLYMLEIYTSYFLHSGGALIPDFRCSL